MKFSFLCWNIRHFKGTNEERLTAVVSLISNLDPDVFGLLEFQAKGMMRVMMIERFPEYDFGVTDSVNGIEITVGWKKKSFQQSIWTQKREFLAGNSRLRPGGLLSLNKNGEFFNLLFLHTDSGTGKEDYENRQEMFRKIWKLEKALRKNSSNGKSNLIALGDLNTMGRGRDLTCLDEIEVLSSDAQENQMILCTKNEQYTWHQWGRGGYGRRRPLDQLDLDTAVKSDLDHVLISQGINLRMLGDEGEKVKVKGWNQVHGQDRIEFLWEISDHSAVYGEVD